MKRLALPLAYTISIKQEFNKPDKYTFKHQKYKSNFKNADDMAAS